MPCPAQMLGRNATIPLRFIILSGTPRAFVFRVLFSDARGM